MRLDFTGRNTVVSDALRARVQGKIDKLSKVLVDGIVSAHVILTVEKYRQIAEVTVHTRGNHMLHGVEESHDMEQSVTQVVEKLEKQARRLKGKWREQKRRGNGKGVLQAAETPAAAPAPRRPRVMQSQRYPVKPMTIDEALLEVEAGDHGFLVFRNAATDTINVVYRRHDGNFGLIEPDI